MANAAPAAASAGGEPGPEEVYREMEAKELEPLVNPDLIADLVASMSGLFYELVAIIAHRGAFAGGGDYIGFSVFLPVESSAAAAQAKENAEKEGGYGVW
ncbi:hypothetical protein NMY22_g16602 [Coprinellus aureogranulatus]|nr:hypothetical protein NMY22_g16602 [Coprinellus aureogranulatus]